jgi:phosphatidylglycerol:prolipoprotein diacylglycerol transferase
MFFSLMFPPLNPVALHLGPLIIRWYALAYLAGIILGWRYALYLQKDKPWRPTRIEIDEFITWVTLGIVLGGRIGYVLVYQPSFWEGHILEAFKVWHGGMSFHGGMIGLGLAACIYCYLKKIYLLAVTDLICAVTPIGLFFGRLANFVNGELWGRPTTVPWGMVFPRGGPEPRHPSQLYEAGLEGLILLAILAVLAHIPKIRNRPGIISGVFLIWYACSRIFIEFFREPDPQMGFYFGMFTMGQILSLPMILVGLGSIAYALKKPPIVSSENAHVAA